MRKLNLNQAMLKRATATPLTGKRNPAMRPAGGVSNVVHPGAGAYRTVQSAPSIKR